MKETLTNSYKHNLTIHIVFIDFKQGFDSVRKEKMHKWKTNKVSNDDSNGKLLQNTGRWRNISKIRSQDLQQGNPLLPILFNLMNVALQGAFNWVGYIEVVQYYAHPDDIAMITAEMANSNETGNDSSNSRSENQWN